MQTFTNNHQGDVLRDWLALTIGNSRLHWAWFQGKSLVKTSHSKHLSQTVENLPKYLKDVTQFPSLPKDIPIYLASVVPRQTLFWKSHPTVTEITLTQIPLRGIYPTMGIDRALALWGAVQTYGLPVLVIDAGTAITLTCTTPGPVPILMGGAILPGLRLQLQSLHRQTAALPTVELPKQLPSRWSLNTVNAIESGVIYTVLAGLKDFISDWLEQFPGSAIALTGGDAQLLLDRFKNQFPTIARKIAIDTQLAFLGIQSVLRH